MRARPETRVELPARCPSCEAPLRRAPRNDVQALVCPECQGLFVPGGELSRLLGREKAALRVLRSARKLACPEGCATLRRADFGMGPGRQRLCICPNCRGAWLEAGGVRGLRAEVEDLRRARRDPVGYARAELDRLEKIQRAGSAPLVAGQSEMRALIGRLTGLPVEATNELVRRPVVTWAVVGACVVTFLVQLALREAFTSRWSLHADLLRAGGDYIGLFTAMFLHGSWLHLLGNMYFLWTFGDNVEDRVGRVGFLALYAATGLMASLTFVWRSPEFHGQLLGASGAISGILGAYLALFPHARIRARFFNEPVLLTAWTYLVFWFALQVINSLVERAVMSASGGAVGVAWWAHIGGFVAGAGLGIVARALPDARLPALVNRVQATLGARGSA